MTTKISGKRPNNTNSSYPKSAGQPNVRMLAYAWGDMATDLIQPFWALPLLAVAKLDFKDILGYLVLACVIYVSLVSAAFLLFV